MQDWVGGLAVVWTLSHVLIYYVSVTHRRILDMDVESLREYLMNIEDEEIAAERARSRGFKWFWNLKKAAVDESITTGSKRMSYVLKKDDEDIRFDLDGLGGFELGNLFADGNIDHDNDKLPSVIQMKKAAEVNAVHGPQVPEHKNVTLVNAEDLMGVSARKGMSDRSAGGEGGVGKEASTNV